MNGKYIPRSSSIYYLRGDKVAHKPINPKDKRIVDIDKALESIKKND